MFRYVTTLILLICMGVANAASGDIFSVSSRVDRVELGKHFYIDLQSSLQKPSLAEVDLSPLRAVVYIKEKSDIQLDTMTRQQRMRLKVYPRQPGDLLIPALRFSDHSSTALSIKVDPAIDPKTGQTLKVYFQYDDAPLWTKQEWMVKANIITSEAILRLETEALTLADFDHMVLSPRAYPENATGNHRHETGWVLHPTRSGQFDLELPAIKYYRDGVNTHNFYSPRLQVSVKPLPVYVPGTVPVGKVSLTLQGTQNPLLISGEINQYQLTVTGEGLQSVDVPMISLHPQQAEDTLHYQAIKTVNTVAGENGVQSKIVYRFPFVSTKTGLLRFAPIRLQYFDPATGRLHSEIIQPASLLSLPLWLLLVIMLTLGVILFFVLRMLFHYLRARWRYLTTCRAVLQVVGGSQDVQEFRMALQLFARAQGWHENPSLQQIKQAWQQAFAEKGDTTVLDLLMRRLYAGEMIDTELIRQQLLSLFYSGRRLFRYL